MIILMNKGMKAAVRLTCRDLWHWLIEHDYEDVNVFPPNLYVEI